MKRGSALLTALWIIAVLSVMVLSFSTEAHLQTGINVYVRERNRVNRLMDAGRVLGEVVLLGYEQAKEWSADEDEEELLEEDRWYKEKRALKYESKCTVGPILLDEEDPDSGTVTIDIELANSGDRNGINVNELYSGGDQNYALRWQMILQGSGLPQELEVEMNDHEGGKKNLMNVLIASWNDWRDDDDSVSTSPLEDGNGDDGAEADWYEEADEHLDVAEEDRRRPRNGSIPDVQELSYVRGFRDFPAVLTGGLLYPDREVSVDNPELRGIIGVFGTTGGTKVNVNDCTVEQLLTIPGIYNEEDTEDQMEAEEIARAIVETLKVMPDYDVDENRSWWPYKDWQDLCTRVSDAADVEIGTEAQQYVCFKPESTSIFKMRITGASMGMKREVNCECYVNSKDKKVRYIKWRED
jgi:hypothetical protein